MFRTLVIVLITITLATTLFRVESYPIQRSFPPDTMLEKRNPALHLLTTVGSKVSAAKTAVGSAAQIAYRSVVTRVNAASAALKAGTLQSTIRNGVVNVAKTSSAAIRSGASTVGTVSKKVVRSTPFKVAAGVAAGAGVGVGAVHIVDNKSDNKSPSSNNFNNSNSHTFGNNQHPLDSKFSSPDESWRNSM